MSGPTETSRLLAQSDETESAPKPNNAVRRSSRVVYPAFSDHQSAKLRKDQVRGPVSFFNSTCARFDFPSSDSGDGSGSASSDAGKKASSVDKPILEWRARDNRKGRHRLLVPPYHTEIDSPDSSHKLISIFQNVWRMFTHIAYWDVSWWIGILFSVGCDLFILTGVLKVAPQAQRDLGPIKCELIGGIAACVGATMFAFAGVLLIIEATNENQTGCFGWAIEQTSEQALGSSGGNDAQSSTPLVKGSSSDENASVRVQRLGCQHCHGRKHGIHEQHPQASRTWEWLPSWYELSTHYIYDAGFIGSMVLAAGTIIFWVSGILSIPQLSQRLSPTALEWTYWLAFLVGGFHFATASILYMLESQNVWYAPNLRSLSWWIGFWDFVGSLGWCLSAGLGGYCGSDWCTWQSDVALLWASVAFEIGSLLLWYEAVEKYPVERAG